MLTHDSIAEGVHFLPDDPPASIGWKLVAVNLSDLAAKGAEPMGALMGMTIFIDSSRISLSPATTMSPGATSTWETIAGIEADSEPASSPRPADERRTRSAVSERPNWLSQSAAR